MDVSFDLLSSMSPKVNKYRQPTRKPPTLLALKKSFRKSLVIENANKSFNDVSVITIESSSEESSSESKHSRQTPIVVSDSDASSAKTPVKLIIKKADAKLLSEEKYANIKLWVDEVNNVENNESMFSVVSTVFGDNSCLKNSKSSGAANSTMLDMASTRFDELFKGKSSKNTNIIKSPKPNLKNSSQLVNNESLLTDDDTPEDQQIIDDSFELNLNDSLETRLKKKDKIESAENSENQELVEYESLLDNLYGSSWREKKEDILPSSEPKLKRTVNKINTKINTERPDKKISTFTNNQQADNNLLKILHKTRFKNALESPWVRSVKNICDPDTDSDSEQENKLQPVRLIFDDNDDDKDKKSWTTETSNSDENTPQEVNRGKRKEDNNSKKVSSFLASLSASVPVSRCDVSALIFRNNFKQNRDALAAKLFKLYNDNVFENSIPKDTPLEWSEKMRRSAGYCYCRKITRRTGAIERAARIVLSVKVVDSADRLRDTLIHEMCHAATWIVNQISDGHGPFWKTWASRAMQAFPELPPIKRCHQYVINTKYTYKCINCGYSVGRHTKSLDTQTKRCGYCFGKFEVLINKTSKKGETKSVPVTPKKPSAFALFVKENYATFKTPDLKHGDVMKILGQKFSSLKVD